MPKIYRKEGWVLNPNDKLVNSIIKLIERNDGECPCANPGETREDRLCPCKSYRDNNICHCNLYIKNDNSSKKS